MNRPPNHRRTDMNQRVVLASPLHGTGANVEAESNALGHRVRGGRLDLKLAAAREQGVEVPMVAAYRKMFNISRGSPVMLANAVLPPALQPLVAWLAAVLRDQSLVAHEVRITARGNSLGVNSINDRSF